MGSKDWCLTAFLNHTLSLEVRKSYVCMYVCMYVCIQFHYTWCGIIHQYLWMQQVEVGEDPVIRISYLKSYTDIMGKVLVWIDTFIDETVLIDSRSFIHSFIHTYILAFHTFIHTYIRICSCIYTFIHIYLHIYTYVRTYLYSYIHTFMNSYVYTYILYNIGT